MRIIIVGLGALLALACGETRPGARNETEPSARETAFVASTFSADTVRERFVRAMTTGVESYEVCTYHTSEASRRAFLARALELDSTIRFDVRESSELVVRESSASAGLHLGLATIEFPTIDLATRLDARTAPAPDRFLSGTPILTRYVTVRDGRRVLVAYSESHSRPEVNRLLRDIESGTAIR
jgi:hypothetical protein